MWPAGKVPGVPMLGAVCAVTRRLLLADAERRAVGARSCEVRRELDADEGRVSGDTVKLVGRGEGGTELRSGAIAVMAGSSGLGWAVGVVVVVVVVVAVVPQMLLCVLDRVGKVWHVREGTRLRYCTLPEPEPLFHHNCLDFTGRECAVRHHAWVAARFEILSDGQSSSSRGGARAPTCCTRTGTRTSYSLLVMYLT